MRFEVPKLRKHARVSIIANLKKKFQTQLLRSILNKQMLKEFRQPVFLGASRKKINREVKGEMKMQKYSSKNISPAREW